MLPVKPVADVDEKIRRVARLSLDTLGQYDSLPTYQLWTQVTMDHGVNMTYTKFKKDIVGFLINYRFVSQQVDMFRLPDDIQQHFLMFNADRKEFCYMLDILYDSLKPVD